MNAKRQAITDKAFLKFDKDANGYVPGEGVGVLLLTRVEQALSRGHRIYGILKSSAIAR